MDQESEKFGPEQTDLLKKAFEAAGYSYNDIDSHETWCVFNGELSTVSFGSWQEAEDWIDGVIFDEPERNEVVERVLHPDRYELERQHFEMRPDRLRSEEEKYCFSQNYDTDQRSGCIGHLRGYFEGDVLRTSWEDHTTELKTGVFQLQLNDAISSLREENASDAFLQDRTALTKFCFSHLDHALEAAHDSFGFRMDTEDYSYLFRLNPNPGEYNLYCYCYDKDMLDASLEEERKITVLLVEPGREPREKEIGTSLSTLQSEVGGMIEVVYPFQDNAAIICNEEGKLQDLPLNRSLHDENGQMYDAIAGSFLIVGLKGDNFDSLTQDQLTTYKEQYRQPEMFLHLDGKMLAVPMEGEDRPRYDLIPVYLKNAQEAARDGERDLYRASMKANIACRDAIEKSISDYYAGNCLHPRGAIETINRFGEDRVALVLANTIQHKLWDERFSTGNKEWSASVWQPAPGKWKFDQSLDYVINQSHPGLVNLFTKQVRQELDVRHPNTPERQSVIEKLQKTKQTVKEAPKPHPDREAVR